MRHAALVPVMCTSPAGACSLTSCESTNSPGLLQNLSSNPSQTTLQRAREEEIEERKAMRRHERDVARKREFVRRVRVQIEERRAEVGGCSASCAGFWRTQQNCSCLVRPVASHLCEWAHQQIEEHGCRLGHAMAARCAAFGRINLIMWPV